MDNNNISQKNRENFVLDVMQEQKVERSPKDIVKTILIWIVIILVCREVFTNTKENAMITAPYYKEPQQIMLSDSEKKSLEIRKHVKNTDALIKPQASYKISARVIAKSRILGDGVSELVPYDVGLVWGDLMKDRNYRRLKIHQYQRWVTVEYRAKDVEFLQDLDVMKHLSNNHMIPANDNVLKGIKKIKKFDKIYAEGYLVYCDLIYKGNTIQGYNSSLTREDTGNHACEIFYVTKLITPRGTWE